MPTLTFYGGINEVGGNKILLETPKSKTFFDFGLSFTRMNMFYDEFMNPRKLNGLGDFFEMGLLPDLKGLYRCDFLKKCSRDDLKPKFDGVFLTHPHIDHTGYIPLLNKQIPVFCGETTKLFLKAMQDTGSGFEMEYIEMKEHFTGLHWAKVPHFMKEIKTFRTGKKINLKDLQVIPIHVDHSIPGAYGYIIHADGKTIVYTGDFRLHGVRSDMTEDFIKAAEKEKADALICEGTRVSGEKSVSEEEVRKKISNHIANTKGLVVANFPPRDTDRFNTFYKAAIENNRKLVINFKQAYLLKILEQDEKLKIPKNKDKNILIYIRKEGDGNFEEKDYRLKWKKEFLSYDNAVTYKDLQKMQNKVVFYCDSYSFNELIDIKPINNSCYIYSLCESFNDAMELDMERFQNWIKHFKLKYYQEHASGHCSKEELKEIVKRIDAKKVIPVHTEDAIEFRDFTLKLELVTVGEEVKV